jgi:Domain of unknown function (DUF5916)/Carbohydrate family 9 binding domain-like
VPFATRWIYVPVLVLVAETARAAETTAPGEKTEPPRPTIVCVRTASPIAVDGNLDEPAWQSARAVTEFRQLDPVEGADPSQRTEVRILHDDDALYIGAILHDTAPDSIIARLTRRDVSIPADRFSVYLDPFHDRRSGFYFSINAAGTIYDGTLLNDDWDDSSWDGVWHGHARVTNGGWVAEMRIPYSQLRFRAGTPMVWGINFGRGIQRRNEWVYVTYRPKEASGFVSRFPDLVGLDGVQPPRTVEILPYITGKGEYVPGVEDDYTGNGGVDVRAGLGSGLTLSATVNPDFGQVEIDPAVVNLSDVETFFQEKRPFFVEGSSIFGFGNQGAADYWNFAWPEPLFFYSRRIGRSPQGGAPDDADVPVGTTILGALKVTGKSGPSWNVGTLHALTQRELASSPTAGNVEVEPLTYYGVARGLREFSGRQHGLGMMGSLVARSFEDPALRDVVSSSSAMVGLDGWTFLDRNKTWVVSGWSAMSHVRGSPEFMTELQQSSRHYFQRPDADHVEVDPEAISMTAIGTRLWLNKQEGASFVNAAAGFMTPGFDVADMGFQPRSDIINTHFGGGYKWTTPGKWAKYRDVRGAIYSGWNFGGNHSSAGVHAGGFTEFQNNWSWDYHAEYNPELTNSGLTRGGPRVKNPSGFEVGTFLDTDGKRTRFYYIDMFAYVQPGPESYYAELEPGIELKPTSNLMLQVGLETVRNREDAQYVTTEADPTATETYGSRYVFAELDLTTVGLPIRLNYAVTPNLSLQLYAQPFFAAGSYSEFKELAAPNTYTFNIYGTGGSTYDPSTGVVDPDGGGPAPAFDVGPPDFNFVSLRGNAVLRWEYTPGSTLFFVWTQERNDEQPTGDFDFKEDSRRLFDLDPTNTFLVKLTYYFTP